MRRVFILLLSVFLSVEVLSHPSDTSHRGKLWLDAEFMHFFKDNEFSAEKMSGYTLPGFYLRPRLVWQVEKRVRIEAGVHWLHYWGATQYPSRIAFSAFPEMGEEPHPSHVLPWMQARVDVLPQLSLVFGSLENNGGHHLPLPLYDPELIYAADPEAGVQILLNTRYFDADVWVDWKDFIYRHSETQERFVFGFSGIIDHTESETLGFRARMPLHVVAQHIGGEMLEDEKLPISMFNFSGGVDAGYRFNKNLGVLAGCQFMGFVHNGNVRMHKRGWGVYPHIGMEFKDLAFDIAYWYGDDFVPLLGSPHFSYISENTPGLVFDPMDILVVSASYKMRQFRYTTLSFDALSYIYFPYSGDRPGYPKVERGAAASFSFGLFLNINPKLSIVPFAKKKFGRK